MKSSSSAQGTCFSPPPLIITSYCNGKNWSITLVSEIWIFSLEISGRYPYCFYIIQDQKVYSTKLFKKEVFSLDYLLERQIYCFMVTHNILTNSCMSVCVCRCRDTFMMWQQLKKKKSLSLTHLFKFNFPLSQMVFSRQRLPFNYLESTTWQQKCQKSAPQHIVL